MCRVSGERVRYLAAEEEKSLFEQLGECEWLKGIVVIALHTGMRRGEICGLQWFDLNFERGLIHVRNTKNGKEAEFVGRAQGSTKKTAEQDAARQLLTFLASRPKTAEAKPARGSNAADLHPADK